MDEISEFFSECAAVATQLAVLVTGGLGLVDNTLNEYPKEEQCQRVWGENSEQLSCREEDNWKAYNNIREMEIPENKNDDNGSIFGLFGGGGDGGNDDNYNSGYDYKPGSSVEESSGGWSIFGWSGASEDYRVETGSDSDSDYNSSSDSSDYSSDSDSGGDSGGDGGSSWW